MLDAASRARLLERTDVDLRPFIDAALPIIEDVRIEGDEALIRYAQTFDRAELDQSDLRANDGDFVRAFERIDPEVIRAIDYAIDNIRRFHEAQMPDEMWLKEIRPGAFAGERYRPIPSVACYVPGGKAAFPSVTMMATIPAVVANVGKIVIITPPGPDGQIDDAILVAAAKVGVGEIYKSGGAQAVAAAAFGTATIPKVAKVVGAGSPYVTAAKRLLADRIDTGTPAGPSEAIVLADSAANCRIAALDLIAESQHGPDSSAFLVTDSRQMADAVAAAIMNYWVDMEPERASCSKAVLRGAKGGIVLAPSMDAAVDFVNDYAPEHLEILCADPFAYLGLIHHAGEILLGPRTPIALGNFVLGPNAVLPSGGAARTWSPLSVFDFLKRSSIGYVTPSGYPALAEQARILAAYEGSDGHASAVFEQRCRAWRGKD
jgi:histidinol dehydrogenase